MHISMLTWNVDWLRNGSRTGKEWEYFECDCSDEVYSQIAKIVKNYFDVNSYAVVFLNEFPYKVKVDRKWNENLYFQKLKDDFPLKEYDIYFNDRDALRVTLAIARKGIFRENKILQLMDNRIISIKKDNLILIGVHMPTHFSRNDTNDNLWINLKNYIYECSNSIVVLGDFNAFVGCKEKLTESRYKDILAMAEDKVPETEKTYIGNTLIDHILVKNVATSPKANVEKEFEFSDHKYMTYSLKI